MQGCTYQKYYLKIKKNYFKKLKFIYIYIYIRKHLKKIKCIIKKIIVNLKRLYEQNKRENGINLNINSFF